MAFLDRLFGGNQARTRLEPLYRSIVAAGRDPAWYREGQVPDTLDGRFDMIAAAMALVLLRLERDDLKSETVLLTELFIDDMEGTVRQIGIGDLMVGKHVGRMMAALGGRLTAFRAAAGGSFEAAVARNIFHDGSPSDEALRFVSGRLERLRDALAASPTDRILSGEVPSP